MSELNNEKVHPDPMLLAYHICWLYYTTDLLGVPIDMEGHPFIAK